MNALAPTTDKRKCALARYTKSFALAIAISAILAVSADVVCYLTLGETSAGTWYNKYWMGFFFCCALIASSFVILRDKLGDKPEYLYLIIVLTASIFMAWSLSMFMVGWDTGVHFRNVLGWADLDDQFELSQSELAFITTNIAGTVGTEFPKTLEGLYHLEAWLNANDGDPIETRTAYSIQSVVTKINYIPCAVVMFLCELADLPFTTKYFLALLPSPIIYSVVTFFGMRKLSSGKMLYAVICLFPTMVFLAANYGYQYWNMAFFMYGFACLAGFMQRREVVPLKEVAFMLAALVIASLPRLSYAPLILLSLLIPRSCFATKKLSMLFRALIVVATILAASVFAVPILLNGLGTGDSRGGSSINPSAQLAYILSDPINFVLRLVEFFAPPYALDERNIDTVSGFLTPSGSINFIGLMGYLGRIPYPLFITILILLIVTIITDKDKNTIYGWTPGIICILASFGIVAAITTYMYMDFNNVGEGAFRGMQARYLLPLIYPSLAFLGSHKWGLIERGGGSTFARFYDGAILGIMAAVLMVGWWQIYLSSIY